MMPMDDYDFVRQMRAALLRELGVREPPFQLKVESDLGGCVVELRDARAGTNDFGQGKFVWSTRLTELQDDQITEKAREAADEIRPHINPPIER
jgi:CRISPR/Cas system Type II protein with McrA/HNH and RuvC-like nuclease domain